MIAFLEGIISTEDPLLNASTRTNALSDSGNVNLKIAARSVGVTSVVIS
mgnify:CR=1 FL=1